MKILLLKAVLCHAYIGYRLFPNFLQPPISDLSCHRWAPRLSPLLSDLLHKRDRNCHMFFIFRTVSVLTLTIKGTIGDEEWLRGMHTLVSWNERALWACRLVRELKFNPLKLACCFATELFTLVAPAGWSPWQESLQGRLLTSRHPSMAHQRPYSSRYYACQTTLVRFVTIWGQRSAGVRVPAWSVAVA